MTGCDIVYIYIYREREREKERIREKKREREGFLQQDPESSYSFGKIQRAAIFPIVSNTFLIYLISHI